MLKGGGGGGGVGWGDIRDYKRRKNLFAEVIKWQSSKWPHGESRFLSPTLNLPTTSPSKQLHLQPDLRKYSTYLKHPSKTSALEQVSSVEEVP